MVRIACWSVGDHQEYIDHRSVPTGHQLDLCCTPLQLYAVGCTETLRGCSLPLSTIQLSLLLPQGGNAIISTLVFVCLSVCEQDYVKSPQAIFMKPSRIMDYCYGKNQCRSQLYAQHTFVY